MLYYVVQLVHQHVILLGMASMIIICCIDLSENNYNVTFLAGKGCADEIAVHHRKLIDWKALSFDI